MDSPQELDDESTDSEDDDASRAPSTFSLADPELDLSQYLDLSDGNSGCILVKIVAPPTIFFQPVLHDGHPSNGRHHPPFRPPGHGRDPGSASCPRRHTG